jgi:hypothetical protein
LVYADEKIVVLKENDSFDVTSSSNKKLDASFDHRESEDNKIIQNTEETIECDSIHEGRKVFEIILPTNVDNLFGTIFQPSQFFDEFYKYRKTIDIRLGEWKNAPDGTKQRTLNFTVPAAGTMALKLTHLTEIQTLRACSKSGKIYSVDIKALATGLPFSDTFHVQLHYCMQQTTANSTTFTVHAQILFTKSVLGIFKVSML